MPYEPLHHKYRPQTFADLVGQEAIATTLTNAIRQTRIAPAYLFTGPRGTGKTSSARILAKSLNCLASKVPTAKPCGVCEVCKVIGRGTALDVIEIDAASNTGVDNIRELIERAQFAPVQCRYKVYVVDECHMLSVAAFNALLKTLEEPPDRVVFVLATTDPQRVLPTIISRCQRFDFRRIPLEPMVGHLSAIATQEGINIHPDAVQLVGQIAQGGLRDAESLLDQLSLLPPPITIEQVWDLVGAVPERDLMYLVHAIAANNPEAVLEQARHLMDRGREPLIVLQNLAGFYRDLLIAKTAPHRQDLVMITPSAWDQLCQLAQTLDTSIILTGQQHLRACEVQIKNTAQPRLWLEVTLLGLLPPVDIPSASPKDITNFSSEVKPIQRQLQKATQPVPSRQLEKHPGAVTSDFNSQKEQVTPELVPSIAETVTTAPTLPEPITVIEIAPVTTPSAVVQDKLSQIGSEPSQSPNPSMFLQPMEERLQKPKLDSSRLASSVASTETHVPLPSRGNRYLEDQDLAATSALAQGKEPAVLSSTDTTVQLDLDQIWQKVIMHLHPPGTQALLRQQGRLLAFNGHKAQIAISSQPLFKMAQARLPNVEAAFEKAFNCQVQASLAVVASSELIAPIRPPEGRPLNTATNSHSPTSATPGLPPVTTPNHHPENTQPSEATPVSLIPPPPAVETLVTQESQPSGALTPRQIRGTEPLIPSWQEDEVLRAAKSLAQFFNGEVVNPDKGEAVPVALTEAGSEQPYSLTQPLTHAEDSVTELEESDDLPF